MQDVCSARPGRACTAGGGGYFFKVAFAMTAMSATSVLESATFLAFEKARFSMYPSKWTMFSLNSVTPSEVWAKVSQRQMLLFLG